MSAKIFPIVIPDEILSDRRREAEIEVYNALKNGLTDSFSVFYNCNWHNAEKRGKEEEGEADFVVAHPVFGLIVLEVKGGIVSRDGDSRQWFSSTRLSKTVHQIKNPIEQARTSKHFILNKLKEAHNNSLGFLRVRHGVVFPHSGRPAGSELGADMPLEIFAFQDDMSDLAGKVIKMLLSDPEGTRTKYSQLTLLGVETIYNLFNKGFVLEPSISTRIKSCEFRIQELTETQNECLRSLASFKRLMISGAAGTGKTCLAIEKAMLLSEEGFEVLYLCHNEALAAHLAKRLVDYPNVKVSSFFKFCLDAAKEMRIALPNPGTEEYWTELPYVLLQMEKLDPNLLLDAILIDEGQDFKQDWIDSIESILRDKAGSLLYMFLDHNQKIYSAGEKMPRLANSGSFELYKNIRNTIPIFELSSLYYKGSLVEPIGPEGLDIELIAAEGSRRNRKLEGCVNRLIHNEGISSSEIAILTAQSMKDLDSIKFKNHTTCSASDVENKGIVLDNIHRFKGLEKEVIILIDISKGANNDALLYVGTTRARSYLIIIDDKQTIDDLRTKRRT